MTLMASLLVDDDDGVCKDAVLICGRGSVTVKPELPCTSGLKYEGGGMSDL